MQKRPPEHWALPLQWQEAGTIPNESSFQYLLSKSEAFLRSHHLEPNLTTAILMTHFI